MKFEKKLLLLLLLLLLLWVFMLIKGYVVPMQTSECAIKSLHNSSFKMDLYMSGRS